LVQKSSCLGWISSSSSYFIFNITKEIKNQIKSNQIKSNQIKSNQMKFNWGLNMQLDTNATLPAFMRIPSLIRYSLLLVTLIIVCVVGIVGIYFARIFHKYFMMKKLDLLKRYGEGSWAVITGASSGQGRVMALKLAEEGFNLLLIGSPRIEDTKKEIDTHDVNVKVKVICIVKDFNEAAKPGFFEDIDVAMKEIDDISILVNNIGHRTAWLPYHESPKHIINDTIACGTLVQAHLCRLVIPYFLKRKPQRSCLINITAQCQYNTNLLGTMFGRSDICVPYLSVYEASNAFGYYHANSLYKEYKDDFDMLNVTPGAVVTENTGFLKDTIFSVGVNQFVDQILRMMGNVNGITCAHWGHEISPTLMNLFPFIKDHVLDQVGKTISSSFMEKYKSQEKTK
jgi:17beta-estradiol 17-dehydrogenase / very-long-chain 3-oxoacyl-CoA reductase